MKIAFILSVFPTLSETFILNQITGLIDLGHEVDIFATAMSSENKVHPAVTSYKLLERTHYFDIPESRIHRITKAIRILFTRFFSYPSVLLKAINIIKYGSLYNCFNNLFYLEPLLGKKYDIMHCHFGPNGVLGVRLKELGIAGKYITTFHGYDISMLPQKKGKSYYKNLMKEGDLFLPISDHWKDKLIEMGCTEEKIIVHRMGINTDYFKFRARRIKHNEKIILLTVARLTEKKGVSYAIKAVAEVLQKHQSLEYRIAGGGPLLNDLRHLIGDLGIQDNVVLLGWLTSSEVQRQMEESHLFILPSVTSSDGDQEGIPVVLMEAQAIGMPVISTWHSGIPELVIDGKSGFLVPERNVDALAKKLEYLIEHPEIWPEMGRCGRAFVEEHYDIRKLNRKLVKIYQGLLES